MQLLDYFTYNKKKYISLAALHVIVEGTEQVDEPNPIQSPYVQYMPHENEIRYECMNMLWQLARFSRLL